MQKKNAALKKDYGKTIQVSSFTHGWLMKQSKARGMSIDDFLQAVKLRIIKSF